MSRSAATTHRAAADFDRRNRFVERRCLLFGRRCVSLVGGHLYGRYLAALDLRRPR